MRILSADSVITRAYSSGTVFCLESGAKVEDSYTVSGVSNDGTFYWVGKGNVFEVLSCRTAERLARHMFGAATKESTSTQITAVCECGSSASSNQISACSNRSILVATTSFTQTGGLVSLLDLKCGIVTKCVYIPFEVTCMDCIFDTTTNGSSALINKELNKFSGAAALGTQTGHIFIIDLRLDEERRSTEQRPDTLQPLGSADHHPSSRRDSTAPLPTCRYIELGERQHVVIDNVRCFEYKNNNGYPIKCLNSVDVYVSCIRAIRQIGCLAVGYNFGSVQLYSLQHCLLEISLDDRIDLAPVSHITYQIPEDDPRYCFYLWIVRGLTSSTLAVEVKGKQTTMSLYQLVYKSREQNEQCGVVFKGMTNASRRLEHDLSGCGQTDRRRGPDVTNSRVIACDTLERAKRKTVPTNHNDSNSEGVALGTGLQYILWESDGTDLKPDGSLMSRVFLSLFDINCWYHSQMPPRILTGSDEICPYWCVYTLDELQELLSPGSVVGGYVDGRTVEHFRRLHQTTNQQFLQPSALSFNVWCWSERELGCCKFNSLQEKMLEELSQTLGKILKDPLQAHQSCVTAGLINGTVTLNHDLLYSEQEKAAAAGEARMSLLTMLLDHGYSSVICNVITDWTQKEPIREGCTVRLLFDWSVQTFVQLKQSIDDICMGLYEGSSDLEFYQREILVKQINSLHRLLSIFNSLSSVQHSAATLKDVTGLDAYSEGIEMLCQYIQAVLLFTHLTLLPECCHDDDNDDDDESLFRFPAQRLRLEYQKRRDEINRMVGNDGSTLLMIDDILSNEGSSLISTFKLLSNTDRYPPANIYTVLSLLRVLRCEAKVKHTVILYVLKDLLAMSASHNSKEMSVICDDYCKEFSVSDDQMSYVSAVWLLDHQFFDEACRELIHVSRTLSRSESLLVIRSLLYQNQSSLALRFIKQSSISQAALPVTCWIHVKLIIAVFLSNGLVKEGLQIIRDHWNDSESQQLLQYVISTCLTKRELMSELMTVRPDDDDGEMMIRLLSESSDKKHQDLLIMYLLHHSLYTQALHYNNVFRKSKTSDVLSKLMTSYQRILSSSSISRMMLSHDDSGDDDLNQLIQRHQASQSAHRLYDRPVPLSATLHKLKSSGSGLRSASSFMLTLLDKKRELNLPVNNRLSTVEEEQSVLDDPVALLSTPVIPSSALKRFRQIDCGLVFLNSALKSHADVEPGTPVGSVVSRRLVNDHPLTLLLQTPPIRDKMSRLASANSMRVAGRMNATPQSILVTRSKTRLISQDTTSSNSATDMLRTPHTDVTTTKTLRFNVPDTSSCSSTDSNNKSFTPTTTPPASQRRATKRKISERDDLVLHADEKLIDSDEDEEITLNFRSTSKSGLSDLSALRHSSSGSSLPHKFSPEKSSLSTASSTSLKQQVHLFSTSARALNDRVHLHSTGTLNDTEMHLAGTDALSCLSDSVTSDTSSLTRPPLKSSPSADVSPKLSTSSDSVRSEIIESPRRAVRVSPGHNISVTVASTHDDDHKDEDDDDDDCMIIMDDDDDNDDSGEVRVEVNEEEVSPAKKLTRRESDGVHQSLSEARLTLSEARLTKSASRVTQSTTLLTKTVSGLRDSTTVHESVSFAYSSVARSVSDTSQTVTASQSRATQSFSDTSLSKSVSPRSKRAVADTEATVSNILKAVSASLSPVRQSISDTSMTVSAGSDSKLKESEARMSSSDSNVRSPSRRSTRLSVVGHQVEETRSYSLRSSPSRTKEQDKSPIRTKDQDKSLTRTKDQDKSPTRTKDQDKSPTRTKSQEKSPTRVNDLGKSPSRTRDREVRSVSPSRRSTRLTDTEKDEEQTDAVSIVEKSSERSAVRDLSGDLSSMRGKRGKGARVTQSVSEGMVSQAVCDNIATKSVSEGLISQGVSDDNVSQGAKEHIASKSVSEGLISRGATTEKAVEMLNESINLRQDLMEEIVVEETTDKVGGASEEVSDVVEEYERIANESDNPTEMVDNIVVDTMLKMFEESDEDLDSALVSTSESQDAEIEMEEEIVETDMERKEEVAVEGETEKSVEIPAKREAVDRPETPKRKLERQESGEFVVTDFTGHPSLKRSDIEIVSRVETIPSSSIMFTPTRRSTRIAAAVVASPGRNLGAELDKGVKGKGAGKFDENLSEKEGAQNEEGKDKSMSPDRRKSRGRRVEGIGEGPGTSSSMKHEVLRSPGRRRASVSQVITEDQELSPVGQEKEETRLRSPGRRKAEKKSEDDTATKSPERKAEIMEKSGDDAAVQRSPGRRRTMATVSETSVKSPARKRTESSRSSDAIIDTESIDTRKSPRLKKGLEIESEEIKSTRSPRKSPTRSPTRSTASPRDSAKSPSKVGEAEKKGIARSPSRRRTVHTEAENLVEDAEVVNKRKMPQSPSRRRTTNVLEASESRRVAAGEDDQNEKSAMKEEQETEAKKSKSPARRRTVVGSEVKEAGEYLTPAQRALKARRESKGVALGGASDLTDSNVSKWSKPLMKESVMEIEKGERKKETEVVSEVQQEAEQSRTEEISDKSVEQILNKKTFMFSPPQQFSSNNASIDSGPTSPKTRRYVFSPPSPPPKRAPVPVSSFTVIASSSAVLSTSVSGFAPYLHRVSPAQVIGSSSAESLGGPPSLEISSVSDQKIELKKLNYDEAISAVSRSTRAVAHVDPSHDVAMIQENQSSDEDEDVEAKSVQVQADQGDLARDEAVVGTRRRTTRSMMTSGGDAGSRGRGSKTRRARDHSVEKAQRLVKNAAKRSARSHTKQQTDYTSPNQYEVKLLTPPTPYVTDVSQAASRRSSAAQSATTGKGRGRRGKNPALDWK